MLIFLAVPLFVLAVWSTIIAATAAAVVVAHHLYQSASGPRAPLLRALPWAAPLNRVVSLGSDPQCRPPWVNVFSPFDIISGSLDYYDLPDRTNQHRVTNVHDPEAATLLGAHVEYWQSQRIVDEIVRHLLGT